MEKVEFKKLPVFQATLENFWQAGIEMGIVGAGNGQHFDDCVGNSKKPWLVVGVKGLANQLQISISTVNRMLADGVIDSATYQYGKTVLFDVNAVLDLLRKDKKK